MWEGREKALNTIKQELVCEVNDTRHKLEKLGRRDKNGSCSVIWARTMSHLWTTIQQSIILWLLFQGDKKTLYVTRKALCTKRDLGGRMESSLQNRCIFQWRVPRIQPLSHWKRSQWKKLHWIWKTGHRNCCKFFNPEQMIYAQNSRKGPPLC